MPKVFEQLKPPKDEQKPQEQAAVQNIVQTQMQLMTKQLQDSFSLITQKMNTFEKKLQSNDEQIKKVERGTESVRLEKQKTEEESLAQFNRLQESILQQQKSMMTFME